MVLFSNIGCFIWLATFPFLAKLPRRELSFDDQYIQRLLDLPVPFSQRRILLLWCLSKWRNFHPALCHCCHLTFQDQDHVVECTDLPLHLLRDDQLSLLEISPLNPSKIVEAYIVAVTELLYSENHHLIGPIVSQLVTHVCNAIRRTRGSAPLPVI